MPSGPGPPKRALRLSMIHSAQVFSPRPSNDPRENLRILQSPLKNPGRSPTKARNPSPLKAASAPDFDEDEEDEEEIVLVQTNHPRVVEEEKDLVILEDIPISLLSPSVASSLRLQPPIPMQAQPQPPRTPPRRKSLGGNALHRAVLIRSAQRAVMKAEREREDEEEEMEVFGAVVDVVDDEEETGTRGQRYNDIEDVEMRDVEDDDEEDNDLTDDEDEEDQKRRDEQKPLWRKSLERIIPWPFGGSGDANGEVCYNRFPSLSLLTSSSLLQHRTPRNTLMKMVINGRMNSKRTMKMKRTTHLPLCLSGLLLRHPSDVRWDRS